MYRETEFLILHYKFGLQKEIFEMKLIKNNITSSDNKEKTKKRMKKKNVILIFLFLLLTYVVGIAISIWNYGKVDDKCSADVAIVLGAATWNGEVSPVFKERINHGIWLYKNGYVEKIILTGGYGDNNEQSDAYIAMIYAVSQGVPEEDILMEEESTITQENLENAKRIMDEKGYKSAILVSDPLHMKRSMLLAKDCGISAFSSPTSTTRYIGTKSKVQFLAREVFFYIGYQIYRIF